MTEAGEFRLVSTNRLSGLGPTEGRDVEPACSWKRFMPHQQVTGRNSQSQDIHMIVEGRVGVANYALSGGEVTLDELPEENYFGELSAIDGRSWLARVISLTNSLFAALPVKAFLDVMKRQPPIASKVLAKLAGVVRASNERIMALSTFGANNQVHAELLRQAR